MPWEVQFRNGVWLPQIGWWLDAHHPVARSFVSHAHFDHLAPHAEIICSEGTARLMRARMPAERCERILAFGETTLLAPGVNVTLYPAGHIHGSAQILIEHAVHGRLLYTGDFKLRPGLSAEICATPRADTLIMETTYGRSHYILPPTAEVLASIVRFCHAALEDGETPVLFGYSLGKSQELLSGLAGANLPAMLHPQTYKLTRIYEELGLTFPPYRAFDSAVIPGHVVICPPQAPGATFLKKIPSPRTAMITGWALDPGAIFRYQCDAVFPLSDHADFPDLLRFVELVQPQRVLTLHGFATDFARTLRDRGIEAWALGQDNQLEIPLNLTPLPLPPSSPTSTLTPTSPTGTFSPSPPARTPIPSPPSPPTPSSPTLLNPSHYPETPPAQCHLISDIVREPADLEGFALIAENIRVATGKLQKIALLRDYFASLPMHEAACAALFFTGRAFPQTDPRTLQLGWAVIKRALLALTGLNEGDYRRAYLRFSDSGDTAEYLLTGRTTPAPFLLSAVADFFAALAATTGPVAKLSLLQNLLNALTPRAAKYLIKIITGDLRIGLKEGLVLEAIAAATARTVEAVQTAHLLCGDLPEVVRAAREDQLAAITLRVFHPLQFMLASPEPTADAILARLNAPVWLEEKYDGIRCQLHKLGDRIELYSRDLNCITSQFPDLIKASRALPGDCILDGELLAWREGRALPFAELQKRLGRKTGDDFFMGADIPVSVSCYDLLWRDGRALIDEPLRARRDALTALISPLISGSALHLAPVRFAHSAAEIEAAFLHARQRGNEGLMAKDPFSAYTPGRRGMAWLKLKKAYATLDVVVVAVEYGHGKRKGVLSDYTFSIRDEETGTLLTVGKAYSGLTDVEIATLTQHFLDHTLEEKGRRRTVAPDVVLEIAFDSIRPSDRHASGFALRFPRIARIRTDKTVAEIDTLATCRKLAAANAFAPSDDTLPFN
jgi:DNA ligase 1